MRSFHNFNYNNRFISQKSRLIMICDLKNMARKEAKNEEYLTILKKLSDGHSWNRVNFEYLEGKRIPHSSLVDRWSELLKSDKIKQVRTSEKSKKGLPLKKGEITLFGFLELFRLANKSDYNEIRPSLKNFLPIVNFELRELMDVFTEEQIFDTISDVCKNTIIIKKNNLSEIQAESDKIYSVTGDLLLPKIKWVHLYDVEIKIPSDVSQISSTRIIFGGEKKSEREIILKDCKAEHEIRGMITFAVFYQLILNLQDVNYDAKMLNRNLSVTYMLRLIESNVFLKKFFLKHLYGLELDQQSKLNHIIKIKNSITKKIPFYKI